MRQQIEDEEGQSGWKSSLEEGELPLADDTLDLHYSTPTVHLQ